MFSRALPKRYELPLTAASIAAVALAAVGLTSGCAPPPQPQPQGGNAVARPAPPTVAPPPRPPVRPKTVPATVHVPAASAPAGTAPATTAPAATVPVATPAAVTKFPYPPARRDESVVDDYHGTKVPDPYRWLEDPDSPETKAFVDAQNKLTASYVAGQARDRLRARYAELFDFPKHSNPSRHGDRYFYSKNDGLQNQEVIYWADAPAGPGTVLLDPNKLSADGTVALSTQSYSHDGTLFCYGLQRSGSDREELHVMPVGGEPGANPFPEVLRDCKFTTVAWKHDNSGFFYNRYPAPGTVPADEENKHNKVYFHQLGTPQEKDVLVYERPDEKDWGFAPEVTEDGRYLVLHVWVGTDPRNRIYYRQVEGATAPAVPGKPVEFERLLDGFDARYNFVGNVGPVFYFDTNLDAPLGRVVAIDTANPDKANWKTIVPAQPDQTLTRARLYGGKVFALYLKDAYHRLYLHDPDGGSRKEVALPEIGAVWDMTGRPQDDEVFLSFESFTAPPTQMRYEISTGKLAKLREPQVKFDPAQFESRQVFVTSKDGTKVPLFVVHKKGLALDGNNPTLLYGYGGFNVSQVPWFSTSRVLWMENGGVWALACIRGGEEYGEPWHRDGSLDKKQNSFDDFMAAGQWLTDNKYTSSKKLAINGGSNGGLLVTACVTQKPSMFGAAIADVPVTDMLRFHKFTVGSFWVPEYGSADVPEQFKYLRAYSPLHNLKQGEKYPPTLITTADTDDRVVPMHAKKFAAAMQAAQGGDGVVLLRVETKAGHGAGKPTAKVIDEVADFYAFLFKAFGMK